MSLQLMLCSGTLYGMYVVFDFVLCLIAFVMH